MASDKLSDMFNDVKFAAMYKTSEKFTGHFGGELIKRTQFKKDLTKLARVDVLDNACGTGVVSTQLLATLDDSTKPKFSLTCADFADAMVNIVKQRIETLAWPNATAVKADAQDTKLPSSHFTHIFFCFGPMLIPVPYSSIKECYRMLAPNGLLGITTWEYVGWYPDFQTGLAKNPKLPELPSAEVFVQGFAKTKERWDRPDDVREHLQTNGFTGVTVESVHNTTSIEVEEAINLLPQVMNIIYTTFWSQEQRNDPELKNEAVEAVAGHLREKYGTKSIVWQWIAILAWGRKPE